MQTIELNAEELIEGYESQNLGEVITLLEGKLWCDGEVICQVIVNDEYLSEADEKKYKDLEIDKVHKLKIVSKKLDDLIQESLSSIIEWLPQAQEASISAAKLVAGEDKELFRQSIVSLLDGCQWFTDSIYLLKSTLNKLGQEIQNEEAWKTLEIQYMSNVKELLQAFENQDSILMADILEYDLSEILNNWLELLQEQDKLLS